AGRKAKATTGRSLNAFILIPLLSILGNVYFRPNIPHGKGAIGLSHQKKVIYAHRARSSVG
ncbi:MAG: hypothetical protein ACYCZR_06180, partial [Burkholderiales bacterium]